MGSSSSLGVQSVSDKNSTCRNSGTPCFQTTSFFSVCPLEKNPPPNIPKDDGCTLVVAMLWPLSLIYPTNTMLSLFLGRRKVGIGLMITVPTDITSVLVAVLNASGTTKQTITETQERGLWARPGVAPRRPVEAARPCRQELLEILSAPLWAAQEQAGQSGPPVE